MNSFLSAVVAVLVATLVAIQAIPLIAPARTSTKYEYLIKDIPDAAFEAEMDKIGDGGYDLR